MADHGYDVADPRDVDPLFGGIDALDRLDRGRAPAGHQGHDGPGAQPHQLAAPVVPGGAGGQSAAAPQRERYIFRDGAWSGRHSSAEQLAVGIRRPGVDPGRRAGRQSRPVVSAPVRRRAADLNWDNPEVFDDLEKTLRFWLERGVDGFRIDVAHGMAKPPGCPTWRSPIAPCLRISDDDPRFNHEGVHDIHRAIRSVLDDYPGVVHRRGLVDDNARFAEYLRADELHPWLQLPAAAGRVRRRGIRDAIENPWPQSHSKAPCRPGHWRATMPSGPSPATAAGKSGWRASGDGAGDARLPGAAFIYNGEELGLPNVDLPDEALQDPVWERSGHTRRGRDGCRVPMPWAATLPRSGSRRIRTPGCRSRRTGRR